MADEAPRLKGTLLPPPGARPQPSEGQRRASSAGESEAAHRLRTAVAESLNGEKAIADEEHAFFESLGLERLGAIRTTMQAHLNGPTQVAEQDVEIYVQSGKGTSQAFKKAFENQVRGAKAGQGLEFPDDEALPPPPGWVTAKAQPALPREEEALPLWNPPTPPSGTPMGQAGDARRPEGSPGRSASGSRPVQVATLGARPGARASGAQGLDWLNPVPFLATALEEIGVEDSGFGFVLRYGKYAPTGRSSEFVVAGLGLSEFSSRLTTWLEAQGPVDYQIQVVDDGSGELTIYLASAVGSNGG